MTRAVARVAAAVAEAVPAAATWVVDEAAAASGLLKGDIVMQAVIDGATHNTNPYTGQHFINLAANAQQTTITVLQTHRMAPNQFKDLPWVPLEQTP